MKILHSVTPVQQASTMSCWAAATTMIQNWKLGVERSIDAVVAQAGQHFTDIYRQSFEEPPLGIGDEDERAFYQVLGLKVFRGQNYSIEGWFDLLKRHGPLSITVDAAPGQGMIHGLVLIGLDSAGTAATTIMSYNDPADGRRHDAAFADFIKLYEASPHWPLQVICHP